MTETLANGYSSESTLRELSNGYQHDRMYMVLKRLCVLVLWVKVASALEGLNSHVVGSGIPVHRVYLSGIILIREGITLRT